MSVRDFLKEFEFVLQRLFSPVSPITPFMYMVRFDFSVIIALLGFCRFFLFVFLFFAVGFVYHITLNIIHLIAFKFKDCLAGTS